MLTDIETSQLLGTFPRDSFPDSILLTWILMKSSTVSRKDALNDWNALHQPVFDRREATDGGRAHNDSGSNTACATGCYAPQPYG